MATGDDCTTASSVWLAWRKVAIMFSRSVMSRMMAVKMVRRSSTIFET